MRLELSKRQQRFRQVAREFLEREAPPSRVREILEGPLQWDPGLWRQICALGWLQLAGLPPIEAGESRLCTIGGIIEEIGRAAFPGPFGSTLAVLLALDRPGSRHRGGELPQALSSGGRIAAPAIAEAAGVWLASGIAASALPDGDGYRLNGTKLFVRDAQIVDAFLVAANVSPVTDGAGSRIGLFVVEATAPGIHVVPTPTVGRDRQGALVLEDVHVPPDSRLQENDGRPSTFDYLVTWLTLFECFEMLGAEQRCVELTSEYARMRVQFGRPIGSFQAVKHRAANMLMSLQIARLLTYCAAWTVDQEVDARAEIARAKAAVSTAAVEIMRSAHQIHGGIGFTREHNLHLFTHRLRSGQLMFGTIDQHLAGLADCLWPAAETEPEVPVTAGFVDR